MLFAFRLLEPEMQDQFHLVTLQAHFSEKSRQVVFTKGCCIITLKSLTFTGESAKFWGTVISPIASLTSFSLNS